MLNKLVIKIKNYKKKDKIIKKNVEKELMEIIKKDIQIEEIKKEFNKIEYIFKNWIFKNENIEIKKIESMHVKWRKYIYKSKKWNIYKFVFSKNLSLKNKDMDSKSYSIYKNWKLKFNLTWNKIQHWTIWTFYRFRQKIERKIENNL